MTEASDTEATPIESLRDPSAVLVEAREKLGLSQKEVADKLFLTTTIIKYIDEGEFGRLSNPAFIRGYLRSYARVVELNRDFVVELYEKEVQLLDPTLEVKGVTEEKVGTEYITGPVVRTGFIGLGLLFLVIGLILWLMVDNELKSVVRVVQAVVTESEPQNDDSPAFEYVLEPTPAAASDEEIEENVELNVLADSQLAGSEPVEVPTSDLQVEPESEMASVASEGAEPVDTGIEPISIERNVEDERNYITVDAGGFDEMSLTFSDECWVEVSDSRHGRVYYDLNRDGDVLAVFGSLPFEVLLGKATGVEMLYNGRPFDLEPYIGPDKTVKIKISD